MHRIPRYFSVVLSMFFSVSAIYGQAKKAQAPAAPVAPNTQLPWYFPKEVFQTSDPVKQHAQYARHLIEQYKCFQGDPNFTVKLSGADSYRVKTDIDSTSSITNPQTKMTLVLDHYVGVPGKKDVYRVSTFCGSFELTKAQVDVVVADVLDVVQRARDLNFAYYKAGLDQIIGRKAKQLGIAEAELRKLLDQKDPRFKNVTYREQLSIPRDARPSDFVPRELHLGYNPEITGGILGVAWLNTGLVYYNPQARVLDYLKGGVNIIQHEQVHNNVNLQEYPQTQAFDAELFASNPEMLYPDNVTDFFFHGYASPMRKLAKSYFGVNWTQIKKEVFRFNTAGNWIMDEEKFRKHYADVQRIKAVFLPFFRDEVIPEFYGNQLWWSALNKRRGDDNAVVRIAMARQFELSGLGGREETEKWLAPRRDRIREIYREAWHKSDAAEESSSSTEESRYLAEKNVPGFLLAEFRRMFTPLEQERIREYFRNNPRAVQELLRMDVKNAMAFFAKFKTDADLVKKGGRR